MNDKMTFPKTFDEFAEQYKIVDQEEVYTNGSELIQIFRVQQWLEHQETDVAKVVHCKDCKWSNFVGSIGEEVSKVYFCTLIHRNRPDRFFCSDGEKKVEDCSSLD